MHAVFSLEPRPRCPFCHCWVRERKRQPLACLGSSPCHVSLFVSCCRWHYCNSLPNRQPRKGRRPPHPTSISLSWCPAFRQSPRSALSSHVLIGCPYRRPVRAVSWNMHNPNQIAVGMEKVCQVYGCDQTHTPCAGANGRRMSRVGHHAGPCRQR